MICFNNHKMPGLWGVPEWEFFLDDLAKHLKPRGRVWLELNQEYDGTFYTPELKEFFKSAAPKSTSRRLFLTQAFARLLQLRQLRVKIGSFSVSTIEQIRLIDFCSKRNKIRITRYADGKRQSIKFLLEALASVF